MNKYNVVLVDDHPLIRDGLRDLINTQPDLFVVGEAESGAQALNIIRETRPHAVVLDIALPDYNGIEIAAQIKQMGIEFKKPIHVIILSMFLKDNLVFQALENGAKGYIGKTASSIEILQAIRYVCQGKYYLSSEVSTNIIPAFLRSRESDKPKSLYDLLTEREQQIFRLLVEGHTNKEIAAFLGISVKTVERHRANIMSKLDVHSFHRLLKYAIELGIIEGSPAI